MTVPILAPLLPSDAGNRPLVSIVMPTWRRAHLIGETIETLLRQSCGDFELIVQDDASPDDTRAVVARPEVVDLTVTPHTRCLQHFADGGRADHQKYQEPLHEPRSSDAGPEARVMVDGAVPPDTSATPAIISTIPIHRAGEMLSFSNTRPMIATSTYPTLVTGST